MTNDKWMPALLTLLLAVLLVAVLLTLQPYSADWPGTAYAKPAQRYIQAAIQLDSVKLLQMSASMSPVRWGLDAGRTHPDTIAVWAQRIQAWIGESRGDTTEVFVYPTAGKVCDTEPIVLRFVGAGAKARVLDARSSCLDSN
jgi:hypothetical protein